MAEAGEFKLVIEDDEGRRSIVPVDLGEVSIGRLDGNTIRLNERNVSRRHARLVAENGAVIAEDLDSYNGVYVNGSRISGRQEIWQGDLIRIGDFQLELRGEALAGRVEQTTQQTSTAITEATQPDIRLLADDEGASTPDNRDAPSTAGPPRSEPTAIIHGAEAQAPPAVESSQPSTISGRRGRILCVSSNLAGQEFELTKTEVVIGRTEDNDIAIDHRSVSRHHAKIVTSERGVKLVDLKSANGTLVNGEEYAQTDLKNGDLIELGHVRFRFAPAGAEFELTADEAALVSGESVRAESLTTAPDVTQVRGAEQPAKSILRSNPILILAIVGLAIAIGVMMTWVDRVENGSAEAPLAAVVAEPELTPVEPVSGAQAPNSEEVFAEAKAAFAQQQWERAGNLARTVLVAAPRHLGAQQLAEQADAELRAQAGYDRSIAAINANQWSRAWADLETIPTASSYAAKAQSLRQQVKAALITEKTRAADSALAAEDWQRAETMADEISSLDPSQPEITRVRAAAQEGRKRRVEAKARTRNRTKPAAKAKAKATPPPAPAITSTVNSAESWYEEGKIALEAGHFNRAVDKFNACVRANRAYCACYRALGITYARQGDGPRAYTNYKKYLKSCPNAKDAPQLEKMLRKWEEAK